MIKCDIVSESDFFLSSQALKNLASTPRQRKSPDNSNTFHKSNNTIYADFRTAYKHLLIPNCYFNGLTEPKFYKTKDQLVVWLKQTKINIWNWSLKVIFYFTKYFLARNTVSPPGKCLWKELFKSPKHSSKSNLFKIWHCTLPQQKGRKLMLCWIFLNILRTPKAAYFKVYVWFTSNFQVD